MCVDGVDFSLFIFQFQSGAVKSLFNRCIGRNVHQFQFQSGAVKSRCTVSLLFQASYFNSKVVRLKGVLDFMGSKNLYIFQFQSGAVKRTTAQRDAIISPAFQFQSGAVKSFGDSAGYLALYSF